MQNELFPLHNQDSNSQSKLEHLQRWLILENSSLKKSTIFQLLSRYSIEQLFQLCTEQLQQLSLSSLQIQQIKNSDLTQVNKSVAWLNDGDDRHILCFDDINYPAQLKEISCPPLILYAQGNITLLNTTQMAIVLTKRSLILFIKPPWDR